MDVCLIHDYFIGYGGGEKVVLELAKHWKCPIYTGLYYKDKTFPLDDVDLRPMDTKYKGYRFSMHFGIAKNFSGFLLEKNYDAFIFSGAWCITAAPVHHPNMLYCHAPHRGLYDLRHEIWKSGRLDIWGLLTFKPFTKFWTPIDQYSFKSFDKIVCNSSNTQRRIKRFYGKETLDKTNIVHPPINTKEFKHGSSEGYFLSLARLFPEKRIDVLIKAFKRMPDKQLIICSDGPKNHKHEYRSLARGCKNIKFTGFISPKEKIDYLAHCEALISIPLNEDFGMVALEANAAGKGVIYSNEGGHLETMNKNVGVPVDRSVDDDLVYAVRNYIPRKPNACKKNASRFSRERFLKKMDIKLKELMKYYAD